MRNNFAGYSQRGLTLVELMVAMAVSLLLLAGVIQIFLSSKQSYRLQEGFSRLQENGRFAVDVLTLNVRHAGFKPNALGDDRFEFPVDATTYAPANVSFATAAQTLGASLRSENNADNTDTILNGSDTVTFRFQGSADIPFGTALADCVNRSAAEGDIVVNTLYVDLQNELQCRSDFEDGTNDDQPLLDGVEGMQVLYGVDTNADRIANRYSTATTITNNGEWARIVSIRVALLLNTVQAVTADPDANTYILLNNAAVAPFNDGLRRHVFTTTIALRNQLP